MKKLDPNDHTSLPFITMMESRATREACLTDDKCNVLHLYMVTHTPMHSTFERTHINFVLAYDESHAACQAECNIFVTEEERDAERKRPSYHVATARVPFLIRGWGGRKF